MLTWLVTSAFADAPNAREDLAVGIPHREEDAPIILGEDASQSEWPMAGGLLATGTGALGGIEMRGRLLMCTSTLIAPDVVLTAAHCVDLEGMIGEIERQAGITGITISDVEFAWAPKADLTAYQFGLDGPAPYPDKVGIGTNWVIHEDFVLSGIGTGLTENYDIALVFLDEPIEDVPFGVLVTDEEDEQFGLDSEVVIVGWGQQTADSQPDAGTVGTKQVATSFVAEISKAEFQVGADGDDPRKCHGDSGGPSFFEAATDSSEPFRVVGVTSHAYAVNPGDPTGCLLAGGVDTRVSHYLEWIDDQMRAACDDGIRSWCRIPGILPPPDSSGDIVAEGGDVVWNMEEGEVFSDEEESEGKGCGCASGATDGSFASLALLVAIGVIRRRRTTGR